MAAIGWMRVAWFAAAAAMSLPACPAGAADDDFYKGRQITIICGFASGGGYDAYARLLGRHLGRNVPGTPSVIVQTMEGASTVRASNYVYVNAPKDGTVIAAVNQNMPMYQMLGGKAAQFEAAKLNWLGSIIGSNGTIYTWHTSATKTIEDAKRRETIMGSPGTNSDSHIYPTLVNNLLGTKFKVINGYAGGTRDINIAVERGEVEGRGGSGWAGILATNRDWVDTGKLNFLVQIGLKPEPNAPQLKAVPMLLDLVTSAEDRQVVEVVSSPGTVGFAYWLAPEVAPDRMALLRRAFDATMQDAEFLAEAGKSGMLVAPKTGVELEAIVQRAATMPKAVLEKAGRALEWKS